MDESGIRCLAEGIAAKQGLCSDNVHIRKWGNSGGEEPGDDGDEGEEEEKEKHGECVGDVEVLEAR